MTSLALTLFPGGTMDINFATAIVSGLFAAILVSGLVLFLKWRDSYLHIKQVREEAAAMDIFSEMDPAEFEVEFEHDYSVYVPYWVYALAGRLGMATDHETSPIPIEEYEDADELDD